METFPILNGTWVVYTQKTTIRAIALTVLALLAAVSFLSPAISRAQAASGAQVVEIDSELTRVADGSEPFSPLDTSSSNGLIATLDSAIYSFDINVNTLDAQAHELSNVTITATLDSTSPDVEWVKNSLPVACVTKTLSADMKTLTCVLGGNIRTGTAEKIEARWFAKSSVPNNTEVKTIFSVSGTLVPDSSGGASPAPHPSNQDLLTVVSTQSNYEVRKVLADKAGAPFTINRDANSNPTSIDVRWGIQVEVKSPTPNLLKGTSTANFSDLTLSDLMNSGPADHLAINQNATLVSCGPVAHSESNIADSVSNAPNAYYSAQDSGTWTCSQPAGAGGPISMNATGIKWAPDWYPGGKVANRDNYWSLNNSSLADEVYGNPAGKNDQAVVATQTIVIRYPYADVLAFDQTPGDRNKTNIGYISWCNNIGNISTAGGPSGVDDPSNNEACVEFYKTAGVGNNIGKYFVNYGGNRDTVPENEIGLTQGALGTGASDNYVIPGQKFGIEISAGNSPLSPTGIDGWVGCDAIDRTKYNFIAHNASTPPAGSTGSAHRYYSWQKRGSPDSSFPIIQDSDIVVEFASTAADFATSTAQRTVNCDDSSLVWKTDPTQLSGGINSANLFRLRVTKAIPPNLRIETYVSVQAHDDLADGERLFNFQQYKTSTLYSGQWRQASSRCLPETDPWNATSGLYSCQELADRAIVILPPPLTQLSDTPNSANIDQTKTITLGSTWTYTMKSGMTFNADVPVKGVHVYNVLPPGLDFVSSTVAPTKIINDCDAAVNQACIETASARTNVGYRTLVWDRGDFDFNYTGTPPAPQTDPILFGSWQVTTKVAAFVPNVSKLQARAWTRADSGIENIDYPITFRDVDTAHNDLLSGPIDDDWIQIATAQSFGIEKYIAEKNIPLNGVLEYNLAFGNLTGDAKAMDAIDILPFNGDARSPNSVVEGGYRLTGIIDTKSLVNKIYVTSDDPSTLNSDPKNSSNPAVGTGKWKCTYEQIGTSGCPADDEITGLRIISQPLTVGQYDLVQIQLTTFGNDGEEVYTNRFQARASGLALPVSSSDVNAVTPPTTTSTSTTSTTTTTTTSTTAPATTVVTTTTIPVEVKGETIVRTITDALPFTGVASVAFLVGLASVLIAMGAVIARAFRRKRKHHSF